MMPRDLTGLPIAITGASSGIGAATALACARAGMPVALAARRIDRCEELAEQIRRQGGRAIAVEADVVDSAACQRLVDRTIEAFGSIYSLYANAGYGIESAVDATSDAELRRIFEVNFFGTMNAIRPALPHMKAARRGHILICSSCLAKIAVPY
ncbi:MAG: SDR family NAD(P)-dependent oxidoreductase, partial [Ferrovibrio sp.]